MKRRSIVLLAPVLLLLVVALPALGRKWTSADGKFSVEAELVDHSATAVKLKKTSGAVITVPLSKLSESDRDFVASLDEDKPASQPSTSTDDDSDAKKAAIDALREKGIDVGGSSLELEGESELAKGLTGVFRYRKSLSAANAQLANFQKMHQASRQQINLLTLQNVQLNSQLAQAKDVATNNKLVGLLNANDGKMALLHARNQQMAGELKKARSAVNEAREQYIQQILDLRAESDKIAGRYTVLAADPVVQAAVAKINKVTGKSYEIKPSRRYESSINRLKSLEDTVLSDSIKLRSDPGGTLTVSVVIDGKHTQEMVLDSGASLISLPQPIAAKCGVVIKPDDPDLVLELADGRKIGAKLTRIPSVRVGKFTVKNVECAVLGPEATSAPPLLGMSFLGNFKFEINAQQESLTMIKVEEGGGGRSR